MPAVTVKKIKSLKGLGIFRDHTAKDDTTDFCKHTLIYGFNGSGKTTLSRVFKSLETGELHHHLQPGGSFEIELSDGSRVTIADGLDRLKGRLLTFSVDFIEQNIRWNEHKANPVFYLGADQASAADELEAIKIKRANADAELIKKKFAYDRADDQLTNLKRDVARHIANRLNLGRQYMAPNLVTDYNKGPYSASLIMDESEQEVQQSLYNQDKPLAKLEKLPDAPIDLDDHIQKVRVVLLTSLGGLALEGLRDHSSMLKWVTQGYEYHVKHEIDDCLFCGNELTKTRKDELASIIDARFTRLTENIHELHQWSQNYAERALKAREALPSDNDIAKEHRTKFSETEKILGPELLTAEMLNKEAARLLVEKANAPNIAIDATPLLAESEVKYHAARLSESRAQMNEIIVAHNKSHDDFATIQETAATKLKQHVLAEYQEAYDEQTAVVAALKNECDALLSSIASYSYLEGELTKKIRQHGSAAEKITQLIANYLGHKELEIAPVEDGFQLKRNGQIVTAPFSEGEKTAIALCYFLCAIEADGRKLSDVIVIIDDPISSLDTKALHYALSQIKGYLGEAAQLIILTHNLHFMNAAKSWLKNRTARLIARRKSTATPTASLLFLDVLHDHKNNKRSTAITELPVLLSEYESEYHYLFKLIRDFHVSASSETRYLYLLPNALRKVLEIFLAFKMPGSDGFSDKIEQISKNTELKIDPARVRALERLMQIESHANSLDDLITHSSMAFEEIRDATAAMFEVMSAMDKPHHDRLCSICAD